MTALTTPSSLQEFEQEDISTTLQKCERYYQQPDGNMFAYRYRSAFIMNEIVLRTRMRAAPTFAFTGTGTATADWSAYDLNADKVAAYATVANTDNINRHISALKIDAEL